MGITADSVLNPCEDCQQKPFEESRIENGSVLYWIECPCGNHTEESPIQNAVYKEWDELHKKKQTRIDDIRKAYAEIQDEISSLEDDLHDLEWEARKLGEAI